MLQTSWPSHTNLYIGWDVPKSTSHPGASRGCKVACYQTFVASKSSVLCNKWPDFGAKKTLMAGFFGAP